MEFFKLWKLNFQSNFLYYIKFSWKVVFLLFKINKSELLRWGWNLQEEKRTEVEGQWIKASKFFRKQSRWRRGDWFIRIEGNQEKKKRERREEELEREGQGGGQQTRKTAAGQGSLRKGGGRQREGRRERKKSFLEPKVMNLQIEKTYKALSIINEKYTGFRKKRLKVSWTGIRIASDLRSSILETRKYWNQAFKILQENDFLPRNLCLVKLSKNSEDKTLAHANRLGFKHFTPLCYFLGSH